MILAHLVLFEVGPDSPAFVISQSVSVLLEQGVDARYTSVPAVLKVLQGQTSERQQFQIWIVMNCFT